MWAVYLAVIIGVMPMLGLSLLRVRQPIDRSLWLLAMAFGVSFLADMTTFALRGAGLGDYQWIPSVTYLVSQVSIIVAVFWGREALPLIGVITGAALLSAITGDGKGPDIILSTIASWAVVGVAWLDCVHRPLKLSLLVTYGLGWAFWMIHAFDVALFPELSVRSWWSFQACRLVGTAMFCYAAYRPSPRLALVGVRT